MKGRIHSIETFGSVDGPGVRFLIFLKGCNLRCRYCHNADTWATTDCEEMESDTLLDKAEKYRPYWKNGGGITVSGGEPLLQIDFLIELFKKAKQRGIDTCLDTAGQPFTFEEPWFSKFQELMQYTDRLLLDMKHIDNTKHMQLTGKPNENILSLFQYLSSIHKPVWIRYVLVPGLTDDEEDLKKASSFIQTLENIERIDVLPYHSLGAYKWEKMGIPYTLKGRRFPK